MKLTELSVREISIPFKINFKHSLADRSKTEAVFVTARSSGGTTGYGEGCPRSYVTGESISSATEFIKEYEKYILDIKSLNDLESFIINYKEQIDLNPAAWCAVETSLLDLMGKESKQSVEQFLLLPELKGEFRYSAVIGDWDAETTEKYVSRYINMKFVDFKIKLSGNLENDLSRLNSFNKRHLNNIKIRLDANKLWEDSTEAYHYLKEMGYNFEAIEEPLRQFSHDGLSDLSRKLNTRIILDESFCRIKDFNKLNGGTEIFIINLRISKMGGILRSLSIARKAVSDGYGLVIGAQVGETSILSRAALTVANKYYNNIIAQEGAFGDYLLAGDIANPQIKFDSGGLLDTSFLKRSDKYGLGLNILI